MEQDYSQIYKCGILDSDPDLRDYTYDMIDDSECAVASSFQIPENFRLEDYDYKILDQHTVGSCAPHAGSMYKTYVDGLPFEDRYSVGWLYAYREDSDSQGTGMISRQLFKNMVKFGLCSHKSFPINEEYPQIKETLKKYGIDKLLKEANNHKCKAYFFLDMDELKEYMVKFKKPVYITVNVYENFYDSLNNGGKIPSKPSGKKRGGHALLVIGWIGDILILVNSWGDLVGDKGIFYLDMKSEIVKDLIVLEDVKKDKIPTKEKYTVGWNKVALPNKTKWAYSNDGFELVKEKWIQVKGIWYYINKEGYALDGEWLLDKGKWYYLNPGTCAMAIGWVFVGGKWYYLDKKSGAMVIGWFQDTNGKWYYLDIDKGYMYSNTTILIDGKYYTFDKSGAMV